MSQWHECNYRSIFSSQGQAVCGFVPPPQADSGHLRLDQSRKNLILTVPGQAAPENIFFPRQTASESQPSLYLSAYLRERAESSRAHLQSCELLPSQAGIPQNRDV